MAQDAITYLIFIHNQIRIKNDLIISRAGEESQLCLFSLF